MFRSIPDINAESFPNVIVKKYYQAADVFRRYDIDYCCGARFPLKLVCEMKGLDLETVLQDLQKAVRVIRIPGALPFEDWGIDFLTSYIVHIHHQYLNQSLPLIAEKLDKFVEEHKKKYSWLPDLVDEFNFLNAAIIPHLQHEEEIMFPYILQISHAFESKESYAGLLVRTLRKPIDEVMHQDHEILMNGLQKIRELTNNYTPPANACTSHHLVFSLLNALDDDLVQHVYLENDILFPKAMAMEKELLARPA